MFSPGEARKISQYISLVLRHQPQLIGLKPDLQGWVPVADLLQGLAQSGRTISREALDELVAHNPKQRYAYSEDGLYIRAQQGHSIPVALEYEAVPPPPQLYHGTATQNLAGIRAQGLHKGSRHHVHLSLDRETAAMVGQRHGKLVILTVEAGKMQEDGYAFFCTPNQVWLTEAVPVAYLRLE